MFEEDIEDKHFWEKLATLLGSAVKTCSYHFDEFTLHIDSLYLTKAVTILRDHRACFFQQLTDITAIDIPLGEYRFEIVYHFLSHIYNKRLRLKISIQENESVSSITSVFQIAGWYEREIFDLYGIPFLGHSDLRRLLTEPAFVGHPFRKDFPLKGHFSCHYDHEERQVIYEPLENLVT